MLKRRRISILSLSLCVLLVLFAFLSMVLAGPHMLHNCHDDQCGVCAVLVATRALQRLLSLAAIGLIMALLALLATHARATHRADRPEATSLITLKIRLNP